MQTKKDEKVLEKTKPVLLHKKTESTNVSEAVKKRENTILSILLTGNENLYQIIKQNISADDFKYELNKQIAKKLYEELEKGNSNINSIIDKMDEEEQNHITEIMAVDYEIDDMEKAIDDLMQSYQKDKLNERKLEILKLLEEEIQPDNKKE